MWSMLSDVVRCCQMLKVYNSELLLSCTWLSSDPRPLVTPPTNSCSSVSVDKRFPDNAKIEFIFSPYMEQHSDPGGKLGDWECLLF